MLSLLPDIQILVVVLLCPVAIEVIPARWSERVWDGSCEGGCARERRCGMDQTWILESSEPVIKWWAVAAIHVTDWRCVAGVETCLPVRVYIRVVSMYARLYLDPNMENKPPTLSRALQLCPVPVFHPRSTQGCESALGMKSRPPGSLFP